MAQIRSDESLSSVGEASSVRHIFAGAKLCELAARTFLPIAVGFISSYGNKMK